MSSNLSQGDQRILTSVFDPENSPDTPKANIDPALPEDAQIKDLAMLAQLRARELQAVRLVEQHSTDSSAVPNLAFGGHQTGLGGSSSQESSRDQVYQQSYSILSQLISEHPLYASAYNNRAQLRRWYHGNELLAIAALRSANKQVIDALDAVFADLDEAIKLASPSGTKDAAVSPAQGKLLAQVWTQRGAILWGLAKALQQDKDSFEGRPIERAFDSSSVPEWRAWDAVQLEEEGSRSFYLAGLYGSEVGRAMAVKTNPYARLCAGIVKEAMASEYDAYKQ